MLPRLAEIEQVIGPARRVAILLALLSLSMALPPQAVRGNDSSASLEAGGLKFVPNGNVAMLSEDLYLSPNEVRVRYLFKNTSSRDVDTLVAFPLPAIHTGESGNYILETSDPVNVVDFKVWVDGRRISPSVQAKASSNGVDITALLRKHGLPLTTVFPNDAARGRFYEMLRHLPQSALSELERHRAISIFKSAPDQPADVEPQWTIAVVFYWQQTFRAGRTVEIRHAYQPVPRHFVTDLSEIGNRQMRATYCTDRTFLAAARMRATKGTLSGAELRYVLVTGRNWAGPIGRFTLTLDKRDPAAIVSTCFRGLRRASTTRFTSTQVNFRPAQDLDFLFLTLAKTP